ncbi:bacterio-opsin activator domain-containing protein [Natrinema halophilum]|uniref:Helix-turn-helix domain-containing protein n=1 Tax=Natrinema halophilum TaxID=1699371 RepID=A0A7D5GK06_9EURY|nr:bacterio-opsin activator domain-containing protein [Natrinema halophilum]QLG51048.1 helix-turn-helix domain-containing protein [Natrinema halophilum]
MSLEEPEASVLTRQEFETFLDAAGTYREALVLRLCGDVGLRPAELTRLTIDDIEQVRIDPPRYLVRVPDDDAGRDRTAYLPTRVERELRRYARSNDLTRDDRIFTVTARRLQMLVSDVAERASELIGDPNLADVSTSDLRQYFAHTALIEHDVNPRVVKTAGGWQSFEALEPYLPEPSDAEIVDAFDAVERPSGPRSGIPQSGPAVSDDSVVRLLLAASDRYGLVRLDEDGYVERWNRSAAAMFGYRAGEIVGTHVSAFYPDDAVEKSEPERTLSTALEESGMETDGWRVHKDGSLFRATEVVSPLRDDRGRHRGFAVFVRDVTAAHDELEAARERRAELAELYAVARCHRDVTHALLESTDHEEVETTTCAALADGRAYDFAWIDRATVADHRREWRASGGIEPDVVEQVVPDKWREDESSVGDDLRPSDPVGTEDRSVIVADDVTATIDGESFEGAVARVSLAYGDTVYGTLSVATERQAAFEDDERGWLETIGHQIGYAIAAIRRRNLLLSDRVTELEVTCRDDRSFLVDASGQFDCRFELDSLVPIGESTRLYYVRLEGASPADVFVLAEADPGIEDCRLVETHEDGWRVEFIVDGSCPVVTLSEYGVTVHGAVFEGGAATITGDCAADADLRTIVDGLRAAFPDSKLVGKREVERTVQTAREFREGLEDRLTDRQEAALRAAYFGGYYDWPRESTAEEVADAMGVSSPTLHNHLRKGQHELLRTFFDEPDR